MSGRRMAAADAAWVGLDRPEHLMVVTAVLRLGRPLDLERLRALVADRLLAHYPVLRQRVVTSGWPLLLPRWCDDPTFDLTEHVTELELGGTANTESTASTEDTDRALMAYVGGLMSTPLDLSRAPWTLSLVRLGDHSAIVARLHHCLADGIALARVLLGLVDEVDNLDQVDQVDQVDQGGQGGQGGQVASPPAAPPRQRNRRSWQLALRVVPAMAQLVASVGVGRPEPLSRLRGPASVGRRAAWTAPLDLGAVKAAATAASVSVNDVLLAAVAGGLHQWLLGEGATAVDVRAMVPVDLRQGAVVPDSLGNRLGIAFVDLPVALDDRRERVRSVHAATTTAKGSAAAPASYQLLRLVGVLPRWGQTLAAGLLGRVATVVVTNVPGPRKPLALGGADLDSVVFWVPHLSRIGVGVSIFSYAGTVTLGVAVNESLQIDPAELVGCLEAELAMLVAA